MRRVSENFRKNISAQLSGLGFKKLVSPVISWQKKWPIGSSTQKKDVPMENC